MSRQASSEWINDNAPRPGASVAFCTLLPLAPVIVIAAVAAVVYGREAAQGRLAPEIRGVAHAASRESYAAVWAESEVSPRSLGETPGAS